MEIVHAISRSRVYLGQQASLKKQETIKQRTREAVSWNQEELMKQTARIVLLQCIVGSYGFLMPSSSFNEANAVSSARRNLMGRHYMLKPKSERLGQEIEIKTPDENPLISKARQVIRSNLGVDDPTDLSDDNFVWINPFVNEPVGKEDYVSAGRFFDIRSAFPDLDYRSYDFRVDPDDSFTIRCTCRVIGTFQEGLRLRNEILSPNGKVMVCPPEGISMTFDPVTMKVIRLCTGFCLDRQVGNTGGCTGIQGASAIAGKPMTTWKNLPVESAMSEVFSLRPKRLENPTRGVRSPFPHTVMVQLARGVLSSNLGADDPSLLSDDEFYYVTPSIGPVEKKAYLRHYAEQELEGYDLNFSSLRVDPYEPDRVWADARPTAPGFQGPPQVLSFSFDLNGRCSRITTSAVLDPSVGNSGGLGGSEGFEYATRRSQQDGAVTSLTNSKQTEPSNSHMDKIDVEGGETAMEAPNESVRMMNGIANGGVRAKEPVRPIVPPPFDKLTIVEQETQISGDNSGKMQGVKKLVESFTNPLSTGTIALNNIEPSPKEKKVGKVSQGSTNKVPKTKTSSDTVSEKEDARLLGGFTDSLRIPDFSKPSRSDNDFVRPKSKDQIDKSVVKRLEGLKDMTDSIRIVPEHISRSFSLLIDTKTQDEKSAAENRRQAATNKRASELKQIVQKKKETPDHTKLDAKLELARKVQALRRERMNRDDLLARARERRDQERRTNLKGNADSVFASSLFGSVNRPKQVSNVPRLAKWRRNADGTITGLVSGSAKYKHYEKVTTSPVKRGKIASKEIVQTGSGSRYYLE